MAGANPKKSGDVYGKGIPQLTRSNTCRFNLSGALATQLYSSFVIWLVTKQAQHLPFIALH